NLRAAFITAAVIPLSMLATITGMVRTGVSANLMSLGALDFGLIVDGAVIIVENCIRRLGRAQHGREEALPLHQRLREVYAATAEVIRPSLFGVAIITAVYIPVFALTGVEGRMFHPMAATVIMALLAAMVFSMTLVPAAVAIFLSGKVEEKESAVMSLLSRGYRRALHAAQRLPALVLLGALALVGGSGWLATTLGSEFVPQLNEGDLALQALRIPGTSLQESLAIQSQLERNLLERMPEIKDVFARTGTAEVATDPMPPNVSDTIITMKPPDEWPDPNKSRATLLDELRDIATSVPGSNYELTQPIEMRFNELISGVRADLAVKVFGDDLEQLQALAGQVLQILTTIPGATDSRVEQVDGLPVMSVVPRRTVLARYGLDVETLQNLVATAIGGEEVGKIYEGDRRFALVVRLPETLRQDAARMGDLPVPLSDGNYVPLSEVATLQLDRGAGQISRENGKRRIVVTANIRDRDLGTFVTDLRGRLAVDLDLPPGYWLEYGGTFEQLASASARLGVVVPVTLALILSLLIAAFGSLKDALIIFSSVPLALSGGVISLWLRGMPLSITAGVGFIALSGIAVLNGLVMVSFIRDRWRATGDLLTSVTEGAQTRLRPVLMTALVASLGFIPMALNTGTGAEVQRPLATVVIGGIVTSTLLTLFVLPLLYSWLHRGDRNPAQEHLPSLTADPAVET
ncbi:MAG: efflux RND transporter permease subunit, partial [Parahaliea sp.]